jgi:hypothetical protein
MTMHDEDAVRDRFGSGVVLSRKGDFLLVHLDAPDGAVLDARTAAFDPDVWFEPGCPLCEIQRARKIFVFDDQYPEDDVVEWIHLD